MVDLARPAHFHAAFDHHTRGHGACFPLTRPIPDRRMEAQAHELQGGPRVDPADRPGPAAAYSFLRSTVITPRELGARPLSRWPQMPTHNAPLPPMVRWPPPVLSPTHSLV